MGSRHGFQTLCGDLYLWSFLGSHKIGLRDDLPSGLKDLRSNISVYLVNDRLRGTGRYI